MATRIVRQPLITPPGPQEILQQRGPARGQIRSYDGLQARNAQWLSQLAQIYAIAGERRTAWQMSVYQRDLRDKMMMERWRQRQAIQLQTQEDKAAMERLRIGEAGALQRTKITTEMGRLQAEQNARAAAALLPEPEEPELEDVPKMDEWITITHPQYAEPYENTIENPWLSQKFEEFGGKIDSDEWKAALAANNKTRAEKNLPPLPVDVPLMSPKVLSTYQKAYSKAAGAIQKQNKTRQTAYQKALTTYQGKQEALKIKTAGETTPQASQGIPPGFEQEWPNLSETDKQDIWERLNQGESPENIKAVLRMFGLSQ